MFKDEPGPNDAIDHFVPKRYPCMLASTYKSQPQLPAHLPYCPDFQYNGKCAKDGLEKNIIAPQPSSYKLDETDILYHIKHLPNRKPSGVDIIGNGALNMVAHLVAPHLATLFNACMNRGYCPAHFKRSKTILFLKPGKTADNPKAYRPIALLSSIGKIFEKFMVKHMKDFVAESATKNKPLLPRKQFGGLVGRSTTMAMQALTNFVYTCWASTNKRKVSLLGLDISGAFPSRQPP
ncbi:hypothetical protein MKX08_002698 [Trichoderma sp. CBMAI-0020]|nr:hypothetical protein MKX08_002698 [Trichoderma sp. CBMAI-0020]